jgi:hypothetical protein
MELSRCREKGVDPLASAPSPRSRSALAFSFRCRSFFVRGSADNREPCRMRFIYCADYHGTSPRLVPIPNWSGLEPRRLVL